MRPRGAEGWEDKESAPRRSLAHGGMFSTWFEWGPGREMHKAPALWYQASTVCNTQAQAKKKKKGNIMR